MCGCNGDVKLFLNPWGLSQLSIQLILPVQTSSSVPGKAEQQADHDQKGCRFVFAGTAEVPYRTLPYALYFYFLYSIRLVKREHPSRFSFSSVRFILTIKWRETQPNYCWRT